MEEGFRGILKQESQEAGSDVCEANQVPKNYLNQNNCGLLDSCFRWEVPSSNPELFKVSQF